jgi:class 3 adenylate cyclase
VAESRRPGRFVFSHALVRETLYAEIPGSKRVPLHRAIGEALAELHPDDPELLAELAHHFIEAAPAGDVERAVSYAERAGRRATDQLAHEAAVNHYERALEALELKRPPERARRLELLCALGDAQRRAGRFVPARDTLESAVELARELEDTQSFVEAVIGVTTLSEAGAIDERIVAMINEALEALGDEDSGERALLLSGLAQELYWVDPIGKAGPLGQEAIEMARRVGDTRTLAVTLTRRQFDITTEADERIEVVDELIRLAEQAGDRDIAARGHLYQLANLLALGDVAGVDRELETYTRLATELRQPQHLWNVPLVRGMRAMMDGQFDDAEALAGEALTGGRRAQEPLSEQFYAIQAALIATHRGTVAEMLPGVREMARRYPAIRAWRLGLVSFLSEAGRFDEARREFDQVAAEDFLDLPRDAQWVVGAALISRACARLGDAERAASLYELLLPYDGTAVVAGRAAACNGPVSLYLGNLALTMSRTADAIRHLEQAVELATRMGDRPFLAQSWQGLAAALLARGAAGDRERALELLGRVLETGQELGMRALVEEGLALRLEAQGLSAVDVRTSIDTMISAVETERPDVRPFAAADGTVTILFSDIENSTLMTERLGDERWLEVLRAHNSIFRQHLRAHGGHEVKSQGDGFMLVFPDPRQAVECAIAIQRELAEREVADGERIRVRMGMHAGEAIREEGDFFGRSVILAARIAAQAGGGEILVSSTLKDLAGECERVSFDGGRELELKGLSGTHRVFSAAWTEADPAAAP